LRLLFSRPGSIPPRAIQCDRTLLDLNLSQGQMTTIA
jgi:hypothetical protein